MARQLAREQLGALGPVRRDERPWRTGGRGCRPRLRAAARPPRAAPRSSVARASEPCASVVCCCVMSHLLIEHATRGRPGHGIGAPTVRMSGVTQVGMVRGDGPRQRARSGSARDFGSLREQGGHDEGADQPGQHDQEGGVGVEPGRRVATAESATRRPDDGARRVERTHFTMSGRKIPANDSPK